MLPHRLLPPLPCASSRVPEKRNKTSVSNSRETSPQPNAVALDRDCCQGRDHPANRAKSRATETQASCNPLVPVGRECGGLGCGVGQDRRANVVSECAPLAFPMHSTMAATIGPPSTMPVIDEPTPSRLRRCGCVTRRAGSRPGAGPQGARAHPRGGRPGSAKSASTTRGAARPRLPEFFADLPGSSSVSRAWSRHVVRIRLLGS